MLLPECYFLKQEEVVTSLLRVFDFEKYEKSIIKNCKGIDSGYRGYGFLIEVENQKPIFLKAHELQDEVKSQAVNELAEYLSESDIVAKPLKNTEGSFVGQVHCKGSNVQIPFELDGFQVSIQEAITGGGIKKKQIDDTLISKMGTVLGKFHKKANEYLQSGKGEQLSDATNNSLSNALSVKVLREEMIGIDGNFPSNRFIKALGFLENFDLEKADKGVVHNDPNHQNFMIREDGKILLIDLNEIVKNGRPAKDVGWLAIHSTIDPMKNEIDIKKTKHLLLSYNKENTLSPVEANMALPLCCLAFANFTILEAKKIKHSMTDEEKNQISKKVEALATITANIADLSKNHDLGRMLDTAKCQEKLGLTIDDKISDFPIGTHAQKAKIRSSVRFAHQYGEIGRG